jgi:predicted dehydrogenase
LDYALVTLRFKNGTLGHVCGSWAHPDGFRTQFEVAGDGGLIEHDSRTSSPFSLSLQKDEAGIGGVLLPENPMAAPDDPYYLELRHFVDCLIAGTKPLVTPADARAAVQIALAALQSIDTGEPVTLS